MGTLDDSHSYCETQVRQGDPDRFHASLFAPSHRRGALFALYAFNLELVRAVTLTHEPMLGAIRLQWWREVIGEIHEGRTRQHPVVQALMDAISRHRLPRALFDDMINARDFDLEDSFFESRAELATYTRAIWGNLFALAARTLAPERAGAFDEAAAHAGEAYGRVTLLRAVAFHARRNKIFLPLDILAQAGVERSAMASGETPAGLRVAFGLIADEAEEALRNTRQLLKTRACPEVLPAFLPLALVKAQLTRLRQIRDPFSELYKEEPLFVRQSRLLYAASRARV